MENDMNIFYLSRNPTECAQMHCDSHTVKMILEYSQLLSTAHRVLDHDRVVKELSATGKSTVKRYRLSDSRDNILYHVAHMNHPSNVWARTTNNNYTWLWCLLNELCGEYTYRYGKTHKVEASGLLEALKTPPKNIPVGYLTQPPQCMPEEYRQSNAVEAYREFYVKDKSRFAKWAKNRPSPEWYNI